MVLAASLRQRFIYVWTKCVICIQGLGFISKTLLFASLWECHMEGFLLTSGLFGLLLLQEGIRRNSGIDSREVPLKSAPQMENKY